MKIVMAGSFGLRPKGTMGVRALPMAAALVRRGHEVTMILPPWDDPELAGRSVDIDGVQVRGLDIGRRPSGLEHARVTRDLLGAVRAERADVVHVFKPKAYAGAVAQALWGMQRTGLFSARLVVDTDDWEGSGGWNDLETFSPLQKWGVAWQERWGLRQCNAVTVASQTLRTLVWALGVPPHSVWYVPNGVVERPATAESDVRSELGLGTAPVVLLYTRFFEFEAQRMAMVWEQIAAAVPAAHLLVVGATLEGEVPALQRLLSEDRRVHFVGWVPEAGLPAYFSAADLAIYPMDDTLLNRARCPVKLVDLMAAGLPVVAESVGQAAEYIDGGLSGILVRPGDASRFARAVVTLLGDVAARRRLGLGAAEQVRERFSWDRLAQIVERAYGQPGAGE